MLCQSSTGLAESRVKARAKFVLDRYIALCLTVAVPTINWYLEILRSPVAKKLIQPVLGEFVTDLLEADDAVSFWCKDHDHDLHTILTMTRAITQEFTITATYAVPYLYRYLVPVLPETPKATAFLEWVFEQETSYGARGNIALIGRRIVASL